MRYLALATDYDGTLATAGRADGRTIAALERLRAAGRRLVLVTGRTRVDLAGVFPAVQVFDLVVAENGATLWRPGGAERILARPPPASFLGLLRSRGVPVEAGEVVLATREPHDAAVLRAIRDLGLDLQIVFNKGAVMVLPPGVNKASGLAAAVAELGLTPHEVVAIGDAENDIAMLAASECGAAVDNALPAVKAVADVVTRGDHGEGVLELVERLVADDLSGVDPPRHHVELGVAGGHLVTLSPAGAPVAVVAGPPGAARTAALAEVILRLSARGYQVCLLDAGGTLEGLRGIAPVGAAHRAPAVEEVVALLGRGPRGVAVNLSGLDERARPPFAAELRAALRPLRARTARPHWLAIEEGDRAPAGGYAAGLAVDGAGGLLLATSRPGDLPDPLRARAGVAIATGDRAATMLATFAAARRVAMPAAPRPPTGEALLWRPGDAAVGLLAPSPGRF